MGALLSKVAGVVIVCRTLSRLLHNVAFSSSCGETFSSAANSRQLEAESILKCLPLQRSPRKLSGQRLDEATGSLAKRRNGPCAFGGARPGTPNRADFKRARAGHPWAKFLQAINGAEDGK